MTFSIAARCPRTGRFGVAVTSSSPAVAARCAHVRPGVGAVCSQNVTDPRLGTRLLDLLESGVPAKTAVREVAAQPHAEWRQLTAVGASGPGAVFSGARTLGTYAEAVGPDAVAAGTSCRAPASPGRYSTRSRARTPRLRSPAASSTPSRRARRRAARRDPSIRPDSSSSTYSSGR